MISNINSKDNKKYKEFVKIKDNYYKDGRILIEGEDLINLSLKNNNILEIISYDESFFKNYTNLKQTLLSKELYRSLSSYKSLPKLMGISKITLNSLYSSSRLIYLDGIQDPGNLGTIFRTALAFNFKDIILSSKCVSPFNFKAVQASKGAIFQLNISYLDDIKELVDKGYKILVTSLDGTDLRKLPILKNNFCLVFGNEGQGVSEYIKDLAFQKIFINMNRDIDSLNVGVSSGIILYHYSLLD